MAKAGKKKGKAKKKPQARVHLPEASRTQQRALLRDVNKLLFARGIVGKVAELRLDAAGTAVAAGDCPPGTTKQVVCRKQPDGTVVCREECV